MLSLTKVIVGSLPLKDWTCLSDRPAIKKQCECYPPGCRITCLTKVTSATVTSLRLN